ncbi:hypothetical protein Ae201684_005360 [Aphanomyces euteiches]|uniref:CYRIA/CYRIB Rac1 binding domain-containing protein n=1 Tax=Aphanomyces euteiches TaxID=100861 RepID=A0A6G0XF76_9STRA|nr:hypothetical protein Ae201684_005360 [Aphanomyces euteiches]
MGNAMQKDKHTVAFGEPETDTLQTRVLGELHALATDLVEQNKDTLVKIQQYQGCQEKVRKSMSSPTNETYRRDSLSQLIPNVEIIQEFYSVAMKQGSIFQQLVTTLAAGGPDAHPELFRRLADVLVFCLSFDNHKTMNPCIQNDLSYYRRYIASNKDNQSELVPETTANNLSFFVADPMPMMQTLIRTLDCNNDPNAKQIVAQLANLICAYIAQRKSDDNKDFDDATELYCLRAMTAAILVYDHCCPKGAFRAKSPIKMKHCLKAIQSVHKTNPGAEQLLDCLRYMSAHLNDSNTPTCWRVVSITSTTLA